MTFLAIVHIAICVFLVVVILLQPGKGDAGIGFGSSSSQSIFGSKGASNFLTKTTSICAIVFLLTSFVLTRSRILEYSGSVIKGEDTKPKTSAPAAPAVDASAPKVPSSATPQTPAAPKAAEPKKK